jgi:hypothetical protein
MKNIESAAYEVKITFYELDGRSKRTHVTEIIFIEEYRLLRCYAVWLL